MTVAPFTIKLDPSAIAPDRTELDINSGAIRTESVDWGDAEVTAFETQEGDYGNSVAAIQLPNRTITIQLGLGMDDGHGGVTQEQARALIQQKVGLLQREGGQVLRQRAAGPAMYADIQKASLTPNDVTGETGSVELWTLVLETLPDFYGDEVALDALTATGVVHGVAKASSVTAVIAGDYPARARIVVADTSGHDQDSLIWGLRSRHYDAASSAALMMEAEALTPINSAASVVDAAASGGHAVQMQVPAGNVWVSFLNLKLLGGAQLTHRGSYRVWVRAKTDAGSPALRLQWGVGSLSAPVINDATGPPDASGYYLLDLGTIRLDAPPVGTHAWFGVIQGFNETSRLVSVDCLYFQPLDEAGGRLVYQLVPAASDIAPSAFAGAGADDGSVGTVAWASPGNAAGSPDPSHSRFTTLTSGSGTFTSHFLKTSSFGFAIPTSATIVGIAAAVATGGSSDHPPDSGSQIADSTIKLTKAGGVVGSNRAVGSWANPATADVTTQHYGGSADLWGTTWAPSDINASGFGLAISVLSAYTGFNQALVEWVQITVYYQFASGLTIAQDAVVFASRAMEMRTDGMFRTEDGTVYGPVSLVLGDLVRLPPSGIEGRPVEVFVKPSRGDLSTLIDGGVDALTATVFYRPCWLGRP